MTGIVCAIVGNFSTAVAAQIIRYKKGITAVGNAQVDTAQSKFGGSSALFDGTGDYLIVQSNPLPTSGSFTVELWIRFSSLGVLRPIWSNRDTGGTNRGVLYISSANTITWWNGGDNLNHTSTLSANTWYHIACVKDGSTRRLLVDGAGMVTDSGVYTAGDLFQIGRADYTSTAFTSEIAGHIDEFRVSNIARYTTTFTPSTTPFVNDTNTLLLMHCDGTDATTVFRDDNGTGRSQRGIIAIGNAQIDTAQSKFGGASALFDGNTDRLGIESNVLPNSGDWTVECWLRVPSLGTQNNIWYAGNNGHTPYISTSGITWYDWSSNLNYTTPLSTNTWYHFVCEKQGTTRRMYLDGSVIATGSTGDRTTTYFYIGAHDADTTKHFNGHLDEFRVSNIARYQGTNFTPSTTPFQNDANTLLLLHMDGTDASTVFFDDNGRNTTP